MELTTASYEAALALGLKPQFHYGDCNALSPFGAACFNDNSFSDLRDFQTATPDKTDMKNWNLDVQEWRDAQQEAIEHAMAYYCDENGIDF